MKTITIHELAVARTENPPADAWTGQDYADVGLSILGGCEVCGGTCAAYNGHPSRSGYWRCSDCIGDAGFATTEDYERWEREGEFDAARS